MSQGGGDDHGYTVQDLPPATVRRDEDALPHRTPPLPFIAPLGSQEKRQRHEHEQLPAAGLPEGPLVEILARVPYRSLCRFKCVSKPWLALCSSRDIRKRSPQTLSGFFYREWKSLRFRNLSGRGPPLVDPSLPFLRESYEYIYVDQVCGSLLLCTCRKSSYMWNKKEYVVCNPATEEWTVLPPILYPGEDSHCHLEDYIGFDAAAPSHFVVFAPQASVGYYDPIKVAIYSSETGQWTYVESQWASGPPVDMDYPTENTVVFVNGTMHWPTAHNSIVTVDPDGKVWREIKMPDDLPKSFFSISIGPSQGRLYAWQRDNPRDSQLYIWVLEDYGTGKWTLKHIVNILELFGRHCIKGFIDYEVFAVHPDCNVIFFTDRKKITLSYNLDDHKLDVIWTEPMYGLPYTPCFAELPRVSAASRTQHGTTPM